MPFRQPGACHYPPGAPGRPLYLLGRAINLTFALLMLLCLSIVAGKFDQQPWIDPVLWAGITSFLYSCADITTVLACHSRSHYVTRVFYDGLLVVGFAISTGFFGQRALPFMKLNPKSEMRMNNPDGDTIGSLGIVILVCCLVQIIVYACFSADGLKETLRHRREDARTKEHHEVAP